MNVSLDAKEKIYFPGLNGLRFIAALCVIITHIELEKANMDIVNLWDNIFIFNLGSLGVYFFFVLSGFLITYLLLSEKKITETISIKNFYLRRIYRIWPLYYLLMLLGFFIFPNIDFFKHAYYDRFLHGDFWDKLFLFTFMLPNLCLAIYPNISHIGHAWSIGVEEQFYLIWPVILKYSKNALRMIIIFTGAWVFLKFLILLAYINHGASYNWLKYVKLFLAMGKIECMTIGALGAYVLFYNRKEILKYIYSKYVQVISLLLIPLLICLTPDSIQDGIHIIFSFLFIIIILNVASNPDSILKLNNKIFDFLGKISYGIYMYHLVIVFSVIKVIYGTMRGSFNVIVANILCYSLSLFLTIFVSWISYTFYEKRFIKMKRKHTKISSGID